MTRSGEQANALLLACCYQEGSPGGVERFVAKRMGATVFETDSSHVPMLSQPEFVLDVIRKAAAAVQKNGELQATSW